MFEITETPNWVLIVIAQPGIIGTTALSSMYDSSTRRTWFLTDIFITSPIFATTHERAYGNYASSTLYQNQSYATLPTSKAATPSSSLLTETLVVTPVFAE